MTVNFEIEDNYALKFKGRHIDLHNNYDFNNYEYKIVDRQLKLTWTKSFGDWVDKSESSKLIFIHSNVFFLTIGYDNQKYEYPQDDKCLGEISFFPSSDRQINYGFLRQDKPKDGDDIIYIFQTEHFIRVGCDRVQLVTE